MKSDEVFMRPHPKKFFLAAFTLIVCAVIGYEVSIRVSGRYVLFDARRAYGLIDQQVLFGDRSIAGAGHARTQEFLKKELRNISKKIMSQEWKHTRSDGSTVTLSNIGISFFPEKKKRILLFTHYDVQPSAFKDKDNKNGIDLGANNGASGVAVLLELARTLSAWNAEPRVGVDIIFFDGEEGEWGVSSPEKWWPIGSQYFVDHVQDVYPETVPFAGVDIDMVCKKHLVIKKEPHSVGAAPWLVDDVWSVGKRIASSVFSDDVGIGIDDDHTVLNSAGIPSVLLIDFDYPPNYTTHDTPDTCSEKSLQAIGDSVTEYIRSL